MRPLLRVLFWPFSVLYGLVVRFRNHLYDIGYSKSFSFQTNVISVGNLGIGGNGKTPMVEYLIRLLSINFKVAVLSRGYGRKTSGFYLATAKSKSSDIGDEPLQMYLKFKPDLAVAVGESRTEAIPKILFEEPDVQAIILDDAFQHRAVKPQFSILVTDYWTPFFDDVLLPSGWLREPRKGAARANVVVVTKCPLTISNVEREQYTKKIQRYHVGVPVFFCGINYKKPIHFNSGEILSTAKSVVLLSGIAKAETLKNYVDNNFDLIEHLEFRDHYQYGDKDIEMIRNKFDKGADHKVLITTEKDMVRLLHYREQLKDVPLYYLPIECLFIEREEEFKNSVLNSVTSYHHSKP